MKKIIPLLTICYYLLSSTTSNAQVGWKWGVGSTGSTTLSYDEVSGSIDRNGNTIATGLVIGLGTLTIGAQSFEIDTSAYDANSIITKTDSSGNFLWSLPIISGLQSEPINAIPDGAGNIYLLVNSVGGSLAIGGDTLTGSYSANIYCLVKLSPSGTVLWAENVCDRGIENINAVQPTDIFGCMAVDEDGNVYISGSFDATSIFGATTLTNTDTTGGTNDIFVVKFNSSGTPIWAEKFGGYGNDGPNTIALTSDGYIYISGASNSSAITFGTTTLTPSYTYSGSQCLNFITKLDTAGNIIWAEQINGHVGIAGMVTDALDNFYFDAFIDSTVVLGSYTIPCSPGYTPFIVAKYDPSGSLQWVNYSDSMGSGWMAQTSIAIDTCGNVWVTSPSRGAVRIDTTYFYSSPSAMDPMMIAEFNNTGNLVQGFMLNSGGDDWNSIAVDNMGNFYLIEDASSCSMAFGADTINVSSAVEELLIAKYKYDTTGGCTGRVLNVPIPAKNADFASVFPNPAHNELTILANDKIGSIVITNLLGQPVYNQKYNEQQVQIDVSNLPPGLYLVKVNGVYVQKFVKE